MTMSNHVGTAQGAHLAESLTTAVRLLTAYLQRTDRSISLELCFRFLKAHLPCCSAGDYRIKGLLDVAVDTLESEEDTELVCDIVVEVFRQSSTKHLRRYIAPLGHKLLRKWRHYQLEDILVGRKTLLAISAVIVTLNQADDVEESEVSLISSIVQEMLGIFESGVAPAECLLLLRSCAEACPAVIRKLHRKLTDSLWCMLDADDVIETLVALVGCILSEKQRAAEIGKIAGNAIDELKQITAFVSGCEVKSSHDKDRTQEAVSSWLKKASISDLLNKYESYCKVVCILSSRLACTWGVSVPLRPVVEILCKMHSIGVGQQFSLVTETAGMSYNDKRIILPTLKLFSLRYLDQLVRTFGRTSLLPICRLLLSVVVDTFEDFSDESATVISPSFRALKSACYEMTEACFTSFGSISIELAGKSFCESLTNDVVLYDELSTSLHKEKAVRGKRNRSEMNMKTSKRRRGRRGQVSEIDVGIGNGPGKDGSDSYEDTSVRNAALQRELLSVNKAGVRALIVMFEQRSIFPSDFMQDVGDIEATLLAASRSKVIDPSLRSLLMTAVASATQGGGSGRMNGMLSSSFKGAIWSFQKSSVEENAPYPVRMSGIHTLAHCGSIAHPRGPPVLITERLRKEKRRKGVAFADTIAESMEVRNRILEKERVSNARPLIATTLHNSSDTGSGPKAHPKSDIGNATEKPIEDTALSDLQIDKNTHFEGDALLKARSEVFIGKRNSMSSLEQEVEGSKVRTGNTIGSDTMTAFRKSKATLADGKQALYNGARSNGNSVATSTPPELRNETDPILEKPHSDQLLKEKAESLADVSKRDGIDGRIKTKPESGDSLTKADEGSLNDTDVLIASLVTTGGPDPDEPLLQNR